MLKKFSLGDVVTVETAAYRNSKVTDVLVPSILTGTIQSGEYVKIRAGQVGLIVDRTSTGNFIVYFAKTLVSVTSYELEGIYGQD